MKRNKRPKTREESVRIYMEALSKATQAYNEQFKLGTAPLRFPIKRKKKITRNISNLKLQPDVYAFYLLVYRAQIYVLVLLV